MPGVSENRVRLTAVAAALSAVALRITLEVLRPAGDPPPADLPSTALLIGGLLGPLTLYPLLTVAGRRRPERLPAGDTPGTLVAPARPLIPGLQLIGGGWLGTNAFFVAGTSPGAALLGAVVSMVSVVAFLHPRPRLVLDAAGVTIHSWLARGSSRVLWSELQPAEPVWTANGTFIGTDRVARVSLARIAAAPVTVHAENLDVEPAYLARVMSGLAAAPDRQAFIDSHLSTV